MSRKVRAEIVPRLRLRCGQRNKEGKGAMITELVDQFGYSRKHAIKLRGAKVGWGAAMLG